MGVKAAQIPSPTFLGQGTSWAAALPSMGRVTVEFSRSDKAQPTLQNVLNLIPLGLVWMDEPILTP